MNADERRVWIDCGDEPSTAYIVWWFALSLIAGAVIVTLGVMELFA